MILFSTINCWSSKQTLWHPAAMLSYGKGSTLWMGFSNPDAPLDFGLQYFKSQVTWFPVLSYSFPFHNSFSMHTSFFVVRYLTDFFVLENFLFFFPEILSKAPNPGSSQFRCWVAPNFLIDFAMHNDKNTRINNHRGMKTTFSLVSECAIFT